MKSNNYLVFSNNRQFRTLHGRRDCILNEMRWIIKTLGKLENDSTSRVSPKEAENNS